MQHAPVFGRRQVVLRKLTDQYKTEPKLYVVLDYEPS